MKDYKKMKKQNLKVPQMYVTSNYQSVKDCNGKNIHIFIKTNNGTGDTQN